MDKVVGHARITIQYYLHGRTCLFHRVSEDLLDPYKSRMLFFLSRMFCHEDWKNVQNVDCTARWFQRASWNRFIFLVMPYIINCISICNIMYMWVYPTKKGFVFGHFYTRIPQLHSGGTWTYRFNAHLLLRPTFLKKKLQCCLLPATLYPVDLCSLRFSFFHVQ